MTKDSRGRLSHAFVRFGPTEDRPPKLLCRVFGHHWTKAPFDGRRAMQGAFTQGAGTLWPYCSRCLTPKRRGLRGRTLDRMGWVGDGPRHDYSQENR